MIEIGNKVMLAEQLVRVGCPEVNERAQMLIIMITIQQSNCIL